MIRIADELPPAFNGDTQTAAVGEVVLPEMSTARNAPCSIKL